MRGEGYASPFGTRTAFTWSRQGTAERTLRITIHENENEVAIKLEGRIAGPWVAELSDAWARVAPRRETRSILLDLSDVTYADLSGKKTLQRIYAESGAELVTSTPWTQFLAQEVSQHFE